MPKNVGSGVTVRLPSASTATAAGPSTAPAETTRSPWPSGSTSLASTGTLTLVLCVIRRWSATAIGGGVRFGVTVTVTVATACAPALSVTLNGTASVVPPASIAVVIDTVLPSSATPGAAPPSANESTSPVASSGSLTNARRLTVPVVPASTVPVPSVAVGGRLAGASTSTVTGAATTCPCWSSARKENPPAPAKPLSGENVTVSCPPAEAVVVALPPRALSQQEKKTMSPSGSLTAAPMSMVTASPAVDVALIGCTTGARLSLTMTASTADDVRPSWSVIV